MKASLFVLGILLLAGASLPAQQAKKKAPAAKTVKIMPLAS